MVRTRSKPGCGREHGRRKLPPTVRILLLLLVAAVGAGILALWWPGSPDPAAPPAGTPSGPAVAPEPAPAPERIAATVPAATAGAVAEPDHGEAAPPPTQAPAVPAASTCELVVRDLAQRTKVPAFRWRFVPDHGEPLRGDGTEGEARLPLPPGRTGALLVEADGYGPESQRIAVPAPGAEPLQLQVFLLASLPLAEVTIRATDPLGEPVSALRIDLWRQPRPDASADHGSGQGRDPAAPPLWTRIGLAADGVFRLPALEPGSFLLRAQPCDEEGLPLPLLPWRRAFAFGGDAAVPLEHAFAAGQTLSLEASEDGRGLRECEVVARDAAGTPIPTLWRSRRADGTFVVSDHVVLLPGRATTVLALPPVHELEVRSSGSVLAVTEQPGRRGVRAFAVGLP